MKIVETIVKEEKDVVMNKPKVSIVVPVYNVEKYLNRCLNSLLQQTCKEIEIILIDDGSTDKSAGICDKASLKDKRVKVIHKKNQGAGCARNTGLEYATGEYIYFVDSDDYIHPNAVEKLYENAKNKNVDICFAQMYFVNEKGKCIPSIKQYFEHVLYQPEITTKILKETLGASPEAKTDTSAAMAVWQGIHRREWLIENNLKFPSERDLISEDMIFYLYAFQKAESLLYLKECLYYHTIDNAQSLTHKYNPLRFHKIGILYREEKRIIGEIRNNDGMIERVQRMYLGNVRVCLKQTVYRSLFEGREFAMKKIGEMVDNPILQEVLQEYPYYRNSISQVISSFLLKRKCKTLLYIVTKLKIKSEE